MSSKRLDTKRPFTRADAVAAGISPRRLGGSRFRRIFHSVYISSSVVERPEERVHAALMLHPASAWISHQTAAAWYGVVVPHTPVVHVSVFDAADRRWVPGIKPHVAPAHTVVARHRGVRVSSPLRMFVELAAVLDLVDLVVAGDNMLRVFGMSADDLRRGLEGCRDYWSPAARHAAAYLRDRVDSPMESRLRMLIVLAGLPEPAVNHTLRSADGEVVVRFDLSYPHRRTAIEYDGRQHVEVVTNWDRDEERRELLDDIEWRIIKVRAKGIYVDPGRTVERIWKVLRQQGEAVRPLSDGWRAHFPGQRPVA